MGRPFSLTPARYHSRSSSLLDHHHRQTGCTHVNMTRIFDGTGNMRCSFCHEVPSIGWLYRCTQDYGGFLPESDFVRKASAPKKIIHDTSSNSLNASVVRGIEEGLYTEDQVQILVGQKERVRDLVLEGGFRPPTPTTLTTDSRSTSGLPESTTFSTTSSMSIDDEIRTVYDWNKLHPLRRPEAPGISGLRSRPFHHSEHVRSFAQPLDVPCNFKICATCRPTYRERAFESIDSMISSTTAPPLWEVNNRPISDARVVANMGHNTQHCMQEWFLEDDTDFEDFFYMVDTATELGGRDVTYDQAKHSMRRRSGFQQTVRRALNAAAADTPMSLSKETGNLDSGSGNEAKRSSSVSRLFTRRKREPLANITKSNGNRDSLILKMASETPLPPTPLWIKYDTSNYGQSGSLHNYMEHDERLLAQI